jgi:hypothetical protein
MAARFVTIEYDTPLLLPPDMRDWVQALVSSYESGFKFDVSLVSWVINISKCCFGCYEQLDGLHVRSTILSKEESKSLKVLTRRARRARVLAFRARVILQCAEGKSNLKVARLLRCHNQTVGHS